MKNFLVKIIIEPIYKTLLLMFSKVLPKDHNLIIFESFFGKQYSDNPRAIYEYMVDQNLDYKLIWSCDRRNIKEFSQLEIHYVRRLSFKWIILMARAKYWISNSRLPSWIVKPKGTYYIQTWHGTPLKRLALDMSEVHIAGEETNKYKEEFLRESGKWDFLISPNAYSSEIFRRAFGFQNTMIESGYPRNDYLINHNNKETISKLKRTMNIPIDKKVILYAPTWRDNQFHAKGRYKFELQMDLDKLKETFCQEYVIILRMHYLVAEHLNLSQYEGFAYDLSSHSDIRELYLISDILITDYSSVFFDFANLRRPMLFYVYDIDEYRDHIRGFYFDFEEKAPGPLVHTTEEIIEEIQEFEQNGFIPTNNIEEFYERFCYLEDGRASERVVDAILGK